MAILIKNMALLVTEENQRITIRERQALALWMAAAMFVLGLVFYWLGSGDFFGLFGDDGEGLGALYLWGGYVMVPAAVLMALASLVRGLRKPVVVDGASGRVILSGKTIDFTSIQEVKVTETRIMDQVRYGLVLEAAGDTERLVRLQDARAVPQMQELRRRIGRLLAGVGPIETSEAAISRDEGEGRRFLALVLIGIGIVWSVTAFFLVPDLAFSGRSSSWGVLVWPLGIWMALLGVLEGLAVPVWRWLTAPPLWRRVLVGVLWVGSYALFSWVDLG